MDESENNIGYVKIVWRRGLAVLYEHVMKTHRRIEDSLLYEGDSNENFKSAIKIQNTDRLSCKLTIMILMV
jgi:hypothetical protein